MKARFLVVVLVAVVAIGFVSVKFHRAEEPKQQAGEFARTTIDLGVVVNDVQKSAKFYTEAVGFKEVQGFEVSADLAGDAGLTDKQPLKIRVFTLGEGESATKLKLMQVGHPKHSDNHFIHSQTGFRYLTVFVKDTN